MGLNAVSINFMPEDIIKKYKPLRKINIPLKFDLAYHPYFLVTIKCVLRAKLIKEREIIEERVVNGLTSSVSKIYGKPEVNEGFKLLDDYSCQVIKSNITSFVASEITEKEIQIFISKKYGHPFRPKLKLETKIQEIKEIYKPFWIVYGDRIADKNSVMVVDAVTGMAGVSEAHGIKSIWIEGKV